MLTLEGQHEKDYKWKQSVLFLSVLLDAHYFPTTQCKTDIEELPKTGKSETILDAGLMAQAAARYLVSDA